METRTRSKRSAAVSSTAPPTQQLKRATRNTRQSSVPRPSTATGTSRAPKEVNTQSHQFSGKLIKDPRARRGAPKDFALSEIGNNSENESDNDDGSGGDVYEISPTPERQEGRAEENQGAEGTEIQVASQTQDDATSIRRDIMLESLNDLVDASEKLMVQLQNMDYRDARQTGMLKVKKNMFSSVKEAFETLQPSSPYLSWSWLDDGISDEQSRGAKLALTCANVATAVEELQSAEDASSQMPFNLFQHLKTLDQALSQPLFYLDKHIGEDHRQSDLDFALQIRIGYMVEAMKRKKKSTPPYEVVASIFCEKSNRRVNLQSLFVNGPFRPLAGRTDESAADYCADELREIVMLIRKGKLEDLARLPERYPSARLPDLVANWAERTYAAAQASLSGLTAETQPQDSEDFQDAMEDISESAVETQQIQRFPQGGIRESPLFIGKSSVSRLRSQTPQSQVGVMRSRNQLDGATSIRGTEEEEEGEEEEDGDDDYFEQDHRPVNETRRRTIGESIPHLPPPKRPRHSEPNAASRRPNPSTQPFSHQPSSPHARFPSTPSQQLREQQRQRLPSPTPPSSTALTSSRADAEDRARVKKEVISRSRAAREPIYQQRHTWDPEDCELLIRLVQKYSASWAAIERSPETSRFKLKRNQQAYRDKARNMKVEFLITDTVLPDGFDSVTLGKKEVERVRGLGKNPFRRVDEVEDGRPINTDHVLVDGDDDNDG